MTEQIRWDYTPGHSIALQRGDLVLTRYVFSPRVAAKPYMHPIHTSGGIPLTAYQPSDHVWHRGLWFAWKYINGVNYWEEEVRNEEGGRQLSDGRTTPEGTEHLAFDGDAAVIDHCIVYTGPDGATTMSERRRVTIHAPRPDGSFRMDYAHAFTVGDASVELSATPATPEQPWGGYAGLGIRTARSMQQFRAVNDAGLEGDKANGARSKWVDLSGVADGGVGRAAGFAMFDHPSNPRHPSPTYVYHNAAVFGYVNLSLVRDEPLTLEAGADLRLAYRTLVHDGWAAAAAFDTEWSDFAGTDPFAHLSEGAR